MFCKGLQGLILFFLYSAWQNGAKGYTQLTGLTVVVPITHAVNNRLRDFFIPIQTTVGINGFINPLQLHTFSVKKRHVEFTGEIISSFSYAALQQILQEIISEWTCDLSRQKLSFGAKIGTVQVKSSLCRVYFELLTENYWYFSLAYLALLSASLTAVLMARLDDDAPETASTSAEFWATISRGSSSTALRPTSSLSLSWRTSIFLIRWSV